jgi:signal peptidase I
MRPWVPGAALALALSPFLFIHPVRISGRSMEPGLKPGDIRLVLRAWCAGTPRPGQVWLLAAPSGKAVKRLVALPGSHVEFRGGDLWVDGKRALEPYVAWPEQDGRGPWETGGGCFFLGDNRPESQDSRSWGALPPESREGRLLFTR